MGISLILGVSESNCELLLDVLLELKASGAVFGSKSMDLFCPDMLFPDGIIWAQETLVKAVSNNVDSHGKQCYLFFIAIVINDCFLSSFLNYYALYLN